MVTNNKYILSAFRIVLLAMFAVLMLSGNASAQQQQQQQKQQEQIKAITKNQPPFTETELNLFLNDYPKLKTMTEEERIPYLINQGWTGPRFSYVLLKTGICHEILQRGGGKDVINQLPKELRPQKGELELVKKNKSKFDSF